MDSLSVLAALVGIVGAVVVAFGYSSRFTKSRHFRKVLVVVMGVGVLVILGASVFTKFSPAACSYQFESSFPVLSFEPQTVEIKYSTRSGCSGTLSARQTDGLSELRPAGFITSQTVAGRDYYSAKYELPGNYSEAPRTIEFIAPDSHRIDVRQPSPLDGLSGTRREAVKIALEFYRKRVPFGDPNDPKSGKDPEKGFDTSGFVAYVLAKVGLIPETEVKTKYWSGALQEKFGTPNVRSITELQPGDLLFEQNKACWFVLSQKQVLGSIPGAGVTVADPSTLGSQIVAYGRVSYPN